MKRYKGTYQAELSRKVALLITLCCIMAALAALLLTTPATGAEDTADGPKCIALEDASVAPEETDENALIENALLDYANENEDVLRGCTVSWYSGEGATASGFPRTADTTVRVNTDVIPLLSDVCVEWPDGTREWYVATDSGEQGGAISIYIDGEKQGTGLATVYWVPQGAIS